MVRLYAGQTSSSNTFEWVELDTLGSENVSLEFSIDDIQKIGEKNSSYSKDFALPFTNTNNKFFEQYYDVDRYNFNFSVYKRIDCRLEAEGVEIINGFLNLINVSKKGEDYFYKIVCYDSVGNLMEILGDDTINDLNFSDILHQRHPFNTSGVIVDNITNSWTNGVILDNNGSGASYVGGATSDAVLYPFVNNTEFFSNEDLSFIFDVRNVPISLKLKYIVDKIFTHAGFSYDSDFLTDAANSYFSKIYFDTTTQGNRNIDNSTTLISDVKVSVNDVGSTGSAGYPVALPTYAFVYQNYAFEQQDLANEFNLVNDTYTPFFAGTLQIYHRINLKNTSAFTRQVSMFAEVTNNQGNNGDVLLASVNLQGNTNTIENFTGYINIAQGANIKIKFVAFGSGCSITNTYSVGSGAVQNPFNQLWFFNFTNDTPNNLIHRNIGEIKLKDIIKDTFKMFNLIIETTNVDKVVKIEPFVDFVNNAPTLDWTDRVDVKNNIVKPTNVPYTVDFKFAEDTDDYFLTNYYNDNGTRYGDFSRVINDIDVTEKSESVQLEVFAPAFVAKKDDMPQQGYFLHIGKKQGETDSTIGYENKPRIFFKNSTVLDIANSANYVFLTDTINGFIKTYESVSSAYHYSDDVYSVNEDTDTLTFGVVNPYNTEDLPVVPTNTLFEKWYKAYINERYNSNSLIYTIQIDLNAQDIYNFSFANRVRINEQEYRVNKINYNTDRNKLAKVELYRI